MNTHSRIASILRADCLDSSITGSPTFDLSALDLPADLHFPLPTNVRLGHLAETIVSERLKAGSAQPQDLD